VGASRRVIGGRGPLSIAGVPDWQRVHCSKANAMSKLGMNNRIDVVRYAALQGWLKDVDMQGRSNVRFGVTPPTNRNDGLPALPPVCPTR
jgi:hypothetical protein